MCVLMHVEARGTTSDVLQVPSTIPEAQSLPGLEVTDQAKPGIRPSLLSEMTRV